MEQVGRPYWMKHKIVLLAAGLSGFALVAFATRVPAHNREFGLLFFLVLSVLCSPFTLRTTAGRLWWFCFALLLGSATIATRIAMTNPLWWLCALTAGGAYAVGACLRWHPPVMHN